MGLGGGGWGEGRAGSLERPPPPPHSHSISHNVDNLMHMAGDYKLYIHKACLEKKFFLNLLTEKKSTNKT